MTILTVNSVCCQTQDQNNVFADNPGWDSDPRKIKPKVRVAASDVFTPGRDNLPYMACNELHRWIRISDHG
jgi:hypothetical protein